MKEEKRQLAKAKAEYVAATDFESERAAHEKVKAAQAAVAAKIVEGAKRCPQCGSVPHGMEQPRGARSVEFEIGCVPCGPFKHDDGTVREFRVRGGALPKHAVEAWNGGPDFWCLAKDQSLDVKPFEVPMEWGATRVASEETP